MTKGHQYGKCLRCNEVNADIDPTLPRRIDIYSTAIQRSLLSGYGSVNAHFLRQQHFYPIPFITQWGRETHICVSDLTIIGSDNGLSPGRHQAIIWATAGILLIGPLGTNSDDILIEILIFSFKKMRLKVPSVKWRPFCLGLNVIMCIWCLHGVVSPTNAGIFYHIRHFICESYSFRFGSIFICI